MPERSPPTTNFLLPDASGLAALVGLALVVVAALIGAMVWWDARAPARVQAAPGTFVRVPLPDGSAVLLGGGAVLRYPRRFGRVRSVALVGEAYVEARSAATAFVVTTPEASVTTNGARFDVRSAGGRTRVAVERGALQVAPRRRPQSASALGAGDVWAVTPGAAGTSGASVAEAAAWRAAAGRP